MIGYFFAILIGLSLGLMGGGGSILTVPVLVYLLKMDPKLSIALSLAIVGSTSLIGLINHFRNKNVNIKIIAVFSPFTMIGAYLGAYLAQYLTGQMQLIIFAIIMLASSILMIKGRKESTEEKETHFLILSFAGIIVGIISGIVGVGGGFLIVPALVLLANLPMKQAVGTSLAVIALSSFTGFYGYLGQIQIPWMFLLKFIALSAIGIIVGSQLVNYISQRKLKVGFGYFLIMMGIFILYKNASTFI